MTKVEILEEPTASGGAIYRAVAGDRQSTGRTAGEALDVLTAQLPVDETGTLVVVQSCRPGEFFTADQQRRLSELMTEWRTARDRGAKFPDELQSELEQLVDAELQASGKRARAILAKLSP